VRKKASSVNANHRLRRRVKCRAGIRSSAGRRAMKNTTPARTRMTINARKCSGMGDWTY
jgi:hypothetical protein